MATDIRRIEPDPAFRSGAVRKVGSRNRREKEEQRDFAEDLEQAEDAKKKQSEPSRRDADRTVSPPTEEDGGTHVDLVG
jgi:hypothetical protein